MAQAQAAPVDPLAGHPRYRKIKDINKGSFGFVVLAENLESREQVAIKFTRVDSESDVKHAHREIMNHQRLLHPHVVQLKEVFSAKPYLALVMEFVPNGDMFQYVVSRRGLPESEARWFFQQLMLGMDYCHRKGVMSRDIKLENTLLVLQPDKKPLLKLCDFGYSKVKQWYYFEHDTLDSIAKSKVGTPGYTAPEVIQNIRGYDGKMADVWSAGVMLYTMLFARYPFERPEDKKLNQHDRLQRILHRIIKVDFVFPESPAISPECRDLIQRILVANPAQRLTIAQIFQHPWVQQDLPQGSLEYNNWALALQVQPAQGDDEVRAVVGDVYSAAKAQAQQASAAAYTADDDNIDSQEYRDYTT